MQVKNAGAGLLFLSLLFSLPANAATKARAISDPAPEIVHTAAGITEVGLLAGTPYRIDVPTAWNHALVVYYHGYAETPVTFRASSSLNEQTQPVFERGYAVIQSGYSATGWALAEAYPDTEQLRLYFLRQYAQRAAGKSGRNMETIVAGGSMGGALVIATLELNPTIYAGGLDLCGSAGATDLAFQRRFAWRAAFDFYFPGVMPPLVPTPPDFQESRTLRLRVEEALKADSASALAMRNLTGLRTDREVVGDMLYFTFVIADMQRRAGGNPFDNRNFLYTGTGGGTSSGDSALNDGVRRYTPDPGARDYLFRHYTPSGSLSRPMLALHTIYDPIIPAGTLSFYAEQVALAGFSQNLVQQYVHRDGHCAFTLEEVGETFDELLRWVHTGQRPVPGLLPSSSRSPGANALSHTLPATRAVQEQPR